MAAATTAARGGTFLPGFGYYAAAFNISCETSKAISFTMDAIEDSCDLDIARKTVRKTKAAACAEMQRHPNQGPRPAWCPAASSGNRYCGAVSFTSGLPCYGFNNGSKYVVGTIMEFQGGAPTEMILGGQSLGRYRKTSLSGQTCFVADSDNLACSDRF